MRSSGSIRFLFSMAVVFCFSSVGQAFVAGSGGPGAELAGSETTLHGIDTRFSLGYMDLHTTELVYDEDTDFGWHKLSELDWEAQGVILAGLSAGWQSGAFTLGAGYWMSLATLDGEMTDYDWFFPETSEWSDRSIGDAEVDISQADLSAGYAFFQGEALRLEAVVGYRYQNQDWEDDGGTYIYSDAGFRDDIGEMDDGPGIYYEVETKFPYIGLRGSAQVGQAQVQAFVIYTSLAEIEANDDHLITGVSYTDEFDDADYMAAGLDVTVPIRDRLSVHAGLYYEHLSRQEGEGTIEGEFDVYPAGVGSRSVTAAVSVGWLL